MRPLTVFAGLFLILGLGAVGAALYLHAKPELNLREAADIGFGLSAILLLAALACGIAAALSRDPTAHMNDPE